MSGQTMPLTAAIVRAVEAGEDVNEVEAAGNTPLHCAAYAGWAEGCELLISLGAKVNASNNAGDRPYHWARNMGHKDVMDLLEKVKFVSYNSSRRQQASRVKPHTCSPSLAGWSVPRAGPGLGAGPHPQGEGFLPEGVLGPPPQAAC